MIAIDADAFGVLIWMLICDVLTDIDCLVLDTRHFRGSHTVRDSDERSFSLLLIIPFVV